MLIVHVNFPKRNVLHAIIKKIFVIKYKKNFSCYIAVGNLIPIKGDNFYRKLAIRMGNTAVPR